MPRQTRISAEKADQILSCVEMKKAGKTYEQIGKEVGVSTATAQRYVQKALKATIAEPTEELIAIQIARYDSLLEAAHDVLRRNHITVSNGRVIIDPQTSSPLLDDGPVLQAIDRILKIEAQRAKLLGLEAPEKLTAEVSVVMSPAEQELQDLVKEAKGLDQAHK